MSSVELSSVPSNSSTLDGAIEQAKVHTKKKNYQVNSFPSYIQCSKQSTPLGQNRFLIIILCVIYVSFTGSIYYGWPGFSNMLFRDGVYAWLCEEGEDIQDRRYLCEAQDTAVQRLFQIAMPSQYIMSIVAGTLIDNVGPRFTAVFGQSINFLAWLLLSLSGSNFNAYVISFLLIGLGADTGFLPTLQTSNLFPGYTGVIIAILGAANSASFAVPTIMDAISTSLNLDFVYICYGYMVIVFVMILYAFFGFPNKSYKDHEYFIEISKQSEGFIVASNHHDKIVNFDTKSDIIPTSIGWKGVLNDFIGIWPNLKSSRKHFFSYRFVAISYYFCSTSLILNFYIVSGEQLLTTDVNTFYGFLNPLSFLPTIVYGKLVDIIGPVRVMAINTTIGFISYILANIPGDNLSVKYISAVGMTIYVSIYTSQMYFFIKDRFDDLHFGKLIGTASMCGGVFSLISVYLYDPLTKVTFDSNYLYVSLMMMGLCLVNYGSFYFMKGHSKFLEQRKIRTKRISKINKSITT